MEFINGINEVANPLLIIIPAVMVVLAGYTVGRIISKIRKTYNHDFFTDLIYGNVILSFLFISGFMAFGFLVSQANSYFSIFTYVLAILSLLGICLIIKSIVTLPSKMQLLVSLSQNKYLLMGILLFSPLILYQGIVIYYHPIFSEYDAVNIFLQISKSILLGDGLNKDFYLGSDDAIKLPPFTQAINSWIIHSFGYSSLRAFPIYYVFLASLFVYALARNITKDSFLSIIASCAFLITPALLIVSSRFSLQQDLAFIFFLGASCYFLSAIAGTEKPRRTQLLMLLVSLSLMSLTREVGLVVAIAFFFLLPALKFTQGNIKLRAVLTVLSLLPFYLLTFNDILSNGLTNSMAVRLISLILANSAIFYVLYHVKNQNQFRIFLRSNLKYLIVFIVPLIFFISNTITIGGPVATFIFSGQSTQYLALYREVFDISKSQDLIQILQQHLPRADIFLVSTAIGSIFVFFRLRGFIGIIEGFKDNPNYVLIIILIIILLVTWSYLLESGYQYANVRHIAYFLPITSTLLVLGLGRNGSFLKISCYALIVFSTYYFLNHDLEISNYHNHFAGFWLEPFKSPIMNLSDFLVAGFIILILIIYEAKKQKINQRFKNHNLARYTTPILVGLLCIQVYTLYSSGLLLSSHAKMDQDPPAGWEQGVFETIEYLKSAEQGNVLSLRAPAISFFTNRTNYDIYNGHVFSSIFPSLLAEKNSTAFQQKISDMNIKYIALPNERNNLYYLTQSLNKSGILLEAIQDTKKFEKISLEGYDLYVFNPVKTSSINLLEKNKIWKPVNYAKALQGEDQLVIVVYTEDENKVYNRAYLQTQFNATKTPIILSLDYISKSLAGNATFYAEIRDIQQNRLWDGVLDYARGNPVSKSFILPKSILDKPIELRLYVVSDGAGSHTLTVTRAQISFGDPIQ